MIECDCVSFRFKDAPKFALRDVSFAVPCNGITAIVGESGVGKSTLIALLAGIYVKGDSNVGDFTGSITVGGVRPEQNRGPDQTSWFPQVAPLLDHLTVFENVMLPLTIGGSRADGPSECSRLLGKMGVADFARGRPRQLSEGIRSRVSLARSLISKPKYLFLDEPFARLDFGNRWNMYELVVDERSAETMSTVMTTHDVPEAVLLADRILVMTSRDEQTVIDVSENDPLARTSSAERKWTELIAAARRVASDIETRIAME